MTDYNKLWTKKAESILLDKKIVKIRWMAEVEADVQFGWNKRPVILILDDGTEIIPQMDDEGNDGGALLWVNPNELVESKHFPGEKFTKSEVLPVF